MLVSIAAAYALLWFSNILEFLQVLVFFFIVPLFGTVILGMLWKRATPAGGFWGFVAAILASMGMWAYVHTFPEGYRPQPKVTISEGSVVALERDAQTNAHPPRGGRERARRRAERAGARVERGGVAPPTAQPSRARPSCRPTWRGRDGAARVQLIAPQVSVAGSSEPDKFGVEGVPVVLRPGVRIATTEITKRFAPAAFNPDHTQYVARSRKAKPMAVNMYSGWWSLVVCVLVTVARQPGHEAEARVGADEPRLRPDAAARRGPVSVVRAAGAVGRDRDARARRHERHLLVRVR